MEINNQRKPEDKTQLYGNVLVKKNHERIIFRGKLDSLQSKFLVAQAIISNHSDNDKLITELQDILNILREMMRCDALNEEYKNDKILGMSHDEIREHSHNPMKYYNIQQMLLPDYKMGIEYVLLNQLRSSIRELEIVEINAEKKDLTRELNRLSSVLHIMMCKYLAGYYK